MSVLAAHYFDGKTSVRHPVSVMVSGDKLRVVGRDVHQEFDARGVRRSLRIANTPRWLYLPGGGACVTLDNDAVDRMTRDRRYEVLLHRWESRPAYAALAVALVVAVLWLLFDRALPVAVEQVAMRIPVETEAALGREALKGMEEYFLKPSNLPPRRREALRAKLDAMVKASGEAVSYRLEFYSSPVMGPNAFALPAGIIVVTDELVKLARNDQEVLGVLAHELGHAHHRHTMRRLLEGSATALVIAAVTGDIASAASLAVAAPTLLLQTKYSRDNEREADIYATHMMRKAGHDPRHLGAFLARLESEAGGRGRLPTFLSSHPATEERQALTGSGPVAEAADGDAEAADFALAAADRHRLVPTDTVQMQIMTLLELREYAGLERTLNQYQAAFEKDAATSPALENAYAVLWKVRPGMDGTLDEWVRKFPASHAARVARASFHIAQGYEARGTAFARDTPREKLAAMEAHLAKARADLDSSLKLTKKPYMSRLLLMGIARVRGKRDEEQAHYLEAVRLAPESVELKLAHMTALEPRWGGSYAAMEAFVVETRKGSPNSPAAARLAARVHAYRGGESLRAKNYEQALGHYDAAIALYPGPNALCERSYTLGQLKRNEDAFADVKLSLSKARDNRYCLERAVSAATVAADANEAIAVLSLVIEVDQHSSHAYNQRGWRYHNAGKADLAYRDYLASAKLDDAWGQLQVGKLLWAGRGVQEDREEALVWLRKSAAQGNRDAKVSLDQALAQLGKAK